MPPLPPLPRPSLLRCPHPRPTVESLTPLPRFTHTPLSHSPSTHPPSVGSSLSPAETPRLGASTTRTALSLPSGPLRARQPPSLPPPPFLNAVVSLSLYLRFPLALSRSCFARPRQFPLDPPHSVQCGGGGGGGGKVGSVTVRTSRGPLDE